MEHHHVFGMGEDWAPRTETVQETLEAVKNLVPEDRRWELLALERELLTEHD